MGAPAPRHAFDDSGFDWDAVPASPRAAERVHLSETDRLAWVVLILLTFCPALGFLLALLAWR